MICTDNHFVLILSRGQGVRIGFVASGGGFVPSTPHTPQSLH